MAAVDPLKASGHTIRLVKILEMREVAARAPSSTRRSWLVETNFEQPYLRVDEELRGDGSGKVAHSQLSIADQVVVALRKETSSETALEAIHKAGFEQAQIISGTASVLVNLDRHDLDAVPEASQKLTALKEVLAAEPDGVGHGAVTPNDTSFNTQWSLYNSGQSAGTLDADVDALELWEMLPALPPFPVAVIDSGLDYNHRDLAGALWTRTADVPGNGIDDDGNGKIDDYRGWDFVNNDNDPMDDNDHGTHVSGIIAARRNNALGIAGLFPEAQIVALKVLNASSYGSTSDLVAALGYVRSLNVRLVNMSLQSFPFSTSVSNEITAGQEQGILYVICAGNQGTDNDIIPNYPGSHPQHNIICVGNSDRRDLRWAGGNPSNYGRTSVDIFAPGTQIPSTVRNNGVSSLTGTSMAAPHVTAAAAILWSLRPEAEWEEVRDWLLYSSEAKVSFNNLCATGRRLNVRTTALAILPEMAIEQPAGKELTSNTGSTAFPITTVGHPSRMVFTVRNAGLAPLTDLAVSISGTHAQDYFVSVPPPESLEPDESSTFSIWFSPSASGVRSALIEITSNDLGESPFKIHITGTGVTVPELSVFEGSRELVNDTETLVYGSVQKGSSVTKTLRLMNTGTGDLTGLQIRKSGRQAEEFTVSAIPATLAPGLEALLQITFDPQASGVRSATLSIASNDVDKNSFDVGLSGIGVVEPEISVSLYSTPATPLTAGASTLDFGVTRTTGSYSTTLVIRNLGTANLTLTPALIGSHASDFSLSAPQSAIVYPGTAESYQLLCRPVGEGLRTATLRILNNDSDENPFDLTLKSAAVVSKGPVFTTQPQSQLLMAGAPGHLRATVSGDPAITYQWHRGLAAIPGAVDDELSIPAVSTFNAAAYTLVADNDVGPPVSSLPAYIAFITPAPANQLLKAGSTLILKCGVTAPVAPGVSVKYSWRRQGDPLPLTNGPLAVNGPVVSGADKPALTITGVRSADAGTYTCLVTLDTPGNDPELSHGSTQVDVIDAAPEMDPIPLPAIVSVSQSLDHTVTATELPSSFTVSGLPAGLAMNLKTGRITGKPLEASRKDDLGAYIPNKITFRARNLHGLGPPRDFYMVIEALDPSTTGTFQGVVARSGPSNFGLGGHVQITITPAGSISGYASLAGQKHHIVGVLDVTLGNDPVATLVVKRTPASLGDLSLQIKISTGEDRLHGKIIEPRIHQMTTELVLGALNPQDTAAGTAADHLLNGPSGVAVLPDGSCYLADTGHHVIRLKEPGFSDTSVFAGIPDASSGDGSGGSAGFNGPEGLALDSSANLYVADTGNSTIRKITPQGLVTTLAGSADQVGSIDGTGSTARFHQPNALCFDPAGNLYVTDRGNHLIRKITPLGAVTTLAGKANHPGHKDGLATAALFNKPHGITYDPVLKALFVADTQNCVIRKVTLTGVVTTYAGSPGAEGFSDGLFANARFAEPISILSLGNGTLVVGDSVLVQLSPNGVAARISERLDDAGSLDHPVALGFEAPLGTIVAVHDHLHMMTRHQSAGPSQDAIIEARRNTWTTTHPVPAAHQGLHNAALTLNTPAPDGRPMPAGAGYVQISVSKNGTATWTGRAADGNSLTFGTTLAADGKIPLHVPLYHNTGSLQGCISVTSSGLNWIDWCKIRQPLASTDRSYKEGFGPLALGFQGSKYVPNHLHSYLGLTQSPQYLDLAFTQSLINFTQSFSLSTPNKVTVPANPRSLSLSIDARTGIFTGSFKNGNPAAIVPFAGILMRHDSLRGGRGHYLLPVSTSSSAPIHSASVRLGALP